MNLITLKLVLIISFPKFEINNYLITTKKEYTFRFYKKKPNTNIYVEIMINRGTYYTSNNKSKHIDTEKENYFEIKCIFNEQNDYLVKICEKR